MGVFRDVDLRKGRREIVNVALDTDANVSPPTPCSPDLSSLGSTSPRRAERRPIRRDVNIPRQSRGL